MANEGITMHIRDTRKVLELFANVQGVKALEVIGSLAREGEGKDLDLVVVVDVYAYITYIKSMWVAITAGLADDNIDAYTDYREERERAVLEALNIEYKQLGELQSAIKELGSIDLFLMPEGWKKRTEEIQGHLPHDDRHFVENIARDAKRVHTSDYLSGNGTKYLTGLGKRVFPS